MQRDIVVGAYYGAVMLAISLCIAIHYGWRAFVADTFIILSESMQPTLLPMVYVRLYLLQVRFQRGFPSVPREEVCRALESRLKDMAANGPAPDVLTFAGNGEPTLHPQFAEIVEDTRMLRDRYFPDARISVLSNATQVFRPEVFGALKKVDNNILKLDTVDADYIRLVDRPAGHYDVDALVGRLKEFKGKVIIQTMFMKGTFEGRDVDNTSERFVRPWIETVKRIAPFEVMIYTIDRETPDHDLRKATHEELDGIADRLRKEGLLVSVSY